MANPYSNEDLDPFAGDFRRAPPPGVASQQAQWSAPPPPATNPEFYSPSGNTAAPQSQPYTPPQAPYPPQSVQPTNPNAPQPAQPSQAHVPESRDLQTTKFWTLKFYQQFFDVDTKQVLLRISNTLVPVNPPDFLIDRNWHRNATQQNTTEAVTTIEGVVINKNPDLYGPFWICTTLWMVLAIVSNIMSRIAHERKLVAQMNGTPSPIAQESWGYDFTVAPVAAITIYCYCFGMSALVWAIMKWKNLPVSLTDTLCLYGYSMFIFLLAALLCMAPVPSLQWFIVFVCGVWSAMYLLVNFWHLWKVGMEPAWFFCVVVLVVVAHVLITTSFKFYFLQYDF